jgi:hypothetical protein
VLTGFLRCKFTLPFNSILTGNGSGLVRMGEVDRERLCDHGQNWKFLELIILILNLKPY